ncbi:hypothetical protein LOD99_8410 [Oopsacas minuta]|uniref:HAT C-terminal dimerisation domain-containing protein n=1 Tax=Oopsacas minuta TaxID=111878 RepID=A0AAV7JG85_9METZ|nr:hypothetical protein LOD99_8410 [Oopsacas minuta]
MTAVDLLCPEEKNVFANVSLSSSTVTRRIEDIAENFKLSLKDVAEQYQYYTIALDESNDLCDTAQFSGFVHGVTPDFHFFEELCVAAYERLCILVDITDHLNSLNLHLQGKRQLINVLFEHICSFEIKLQLWENQLQEKNFVHFPTLKANNPDDTGTYVSFISDLRAQFSARFMDVQKYKSDFRLLVASFDVSVDEAAELVQMKLVDLQCNDLLKSKFRDCEDDIITFYQKYLTEQQFPELRKHATKFCCIFGSTFICEQLFSKMKSTKSITRTRLTDDHLNDVLRITTTVSIPNFETLSKQRKQHQVSH